MVVLSSEALNGVNISGSLNDGGYQCTFTLKDAADQIEPDQEVILYIDDKYGRNWVGSSQVFRGYVPSGNITLNNESGLFEITAHTADYMLRRLFLPGTAFREGNNENTKTPSSLKLSYIINNILTRMTNAGDYITWLLEESEAQIAEYSIDEGDPWSWFEEIAKYDQYLLYFERSNRLRYRKHPMFAASLSPSIFDFNAETMVDITVQQLDPNQVSQVYATGFYKYDTFSKLYPATPVETGGRLLQLSIPVKAQASLDEIARRAFIFNNSKWAATVRDMRNHHLELADIVTVTHTDLNNDIDWSYGKRFYVNSVNIDLQFNEGNSELNSEFELIEIPESIFFNAN